ncbi:MAG: GTP-binding protein [Pseudomonadota bacterium]
MDEASPIPVTVIGGYLGSGKTTLVNHLLRHADGRRLAILVNEFGELPIDADLIEATGDDIISLTGGCVCCSYGNDLFMALTEMQKLDPAPDHIVLEASGVALPGAIAASVSLVQGYEVRGVVVLADCETVQQRAGDKFMGDTITRQLADADTVLLNKIDLVSAPTAKATGQWLAGKAARASVVETNRSRVHPDVVLSSYGCKTLPTQSGPYGHTNGITSHIVIPDQPVVAKNFAQTLVAETPGIVRAKGFVKDSDGTMKTLQAVGERIEITDAPEGSDAGVVVIYMREAEGS